MTKTDRIRELDAYTDATPALIKSIIDMEYGEHTEHQFAALLWAARNRQPKRGRPRTRGPACTHCQGTGLEPQVTP